MTHNLAHFGFVNPCRLNSLRHRCVSRQQQHVALTNQFFRAGLVQDHATVSKARYRKCHTRRNVGFDNTRDDVDAWALCCNDQVNTDRTSLLRNASDAVFYVASRNHHQVIQLINHNQDVRNAIKTLISVLFFRQIATVVRSVVTNDVSETSLNQQVVASLHLFDCPTQRIGSLLWVCYWRREQVWQPRVLRHFNLLWVNQNHLHLIRSRTHQHRRDDAVNRTRLTSTRGTSNQHVWSCRDIEKHCPTSNVFAHSDIKWMPGCTRFLRHHQVAK